MSETPSNDQPSQEFNQLDLSQLQDFSFGTQWSQDKSSGPASRDPRPRRDDRPRRAGPDGGPDARRDRRGFRKPAGGDGQPGAPREGGGGRDAFPRRGGGGGGPRRDERPRREGPAGERSRFGGPRELPVGPYISPFFNVTFYPEDAGFAALAKAVRASCRTYELFEIARVVIGKNDRFIAVVQRNAPEGSSGKPAPFAISMPDGLPFESEDAAIDHVMATHLDKFFEVTETEVAPPTGNFQVVNRCAMTGELLGPPNYHLYNQIVAQHHQAADIRMSLEAYRSAKIEGVRDPEVIAQWLEKMKKGVCYTWRTAPAATTKVSPADAAPAAVTAAAESPDAETSAAETASAASETAPEVEATPVAETDPATEAIPVTEAAPAAEAAEAEAAEAEVPAATDTPEPVAEAAPDAPEAPTFDAIEAARAHLLTHARAQVVRTVETLRLPGRLLEALPPGEIRRAVEGQLERQQKFPLDTANALRGRLRREGFTIFKKGSKGISYVCAVKRKFRVPSQVFSDSIGALISFIEAHPMIRQNELPAKHLGLTLPVAAAEGEETPALTPEVHSQLTKLNMDLRWLVGEGYVTEFIDGRLFTPPPMHESRKRDGGAEEHDPENFPEAPADEPAAKKAPAAKKESSSSAVAAEQPADTAESATPVAAAAPAVAETTPTTASATETPVPAVDAPETKEDQSLKTEESTATTAAPASADDVAEAPVAEVPPAPAVDTPEAQASEPLKTDEPAD